MERQQQQQQQEQIGCNNSIIYIKVFLLLCLLLFVTIINNIILSSVIVNNVRTTNQALLPNNNDDAVKTMLLTTTCPFHYTTPIIIRRHYYNNNQYSSINDNYTIANTTTSNNNVCYFLDIPFSDHFPHALQQLIRCWSYWQQQVEENNNKGFDKHPILQFDINTYAYRTRRFKDWIGIRQPKFLLGILWDLERLGITIRMKKTDDTIIINTTTTTNNNNIIIKPAYQVRTPNDTILLAKSIRKLHNIPERSNSCYKSEPIIGIINRDAITSYRSILNINEIVNILQQKLKYNVKTAYFENISFINQIKFMSSIDLLITPHGAQCTAMIFMGSNGKCNGIMEIFPEGYYLPDFFGSLADSSGIRHYSLYQSNNTVTIPTQSIRNMSRKVNLCPNPNTVLDGIQQMIFDWHECCNKQK